MLDLPNPTITPYMASETDNLHTLSVGGGKRAFRVDKDGISLGANTWKDAPFRVDMDGNTRMNNADIRGTISGRSTDTIASVITANGNIVTERMNFETGKVLKEFTFAGYEGAFKSGDIYWNKQTGAISGGSGVVMMQNGIVGAKNGSPTFVLSTNGDATFSGTLTAPNGTLGNITAGNIAGVNIRGSNIVGTTLKTAESGSRVEITGTSLRTYDNGYYPRFQTSQNGVRFGHASRNLVSDFYLSGSTYDYGSEMPIIRMTGMINPDAINASNIKGFGANISNIESNTIHVSNLYVNGQAIDGGGGGGNNDPSIVRLVANYAGFVTLEANGQRFAITKR